MISKTLKTKIINLLKPVNPYKIILFGSYAYGLPTNNSDIDLIVVTYDEIIPENYHEKMKIYLKVSNTLSEIIEEVPIDLLVYTKPMFEKFIELNSMFARDIIQKGVLL